MAVFFMDITQTPKPMRLETAVIDSSALSGYKISPSPCRGCPNFGRRWACPPFDTPPAELFSLDSLDAKIVLAAVLVEPQKNLSPLQCVEAAPKIYDEIFYEVERLFPGCQILLAGSCVCPLSQNCPRVSGKKCAFEDRRRMSLESLSYNVVKICRDFLGFEVLWAKGGNQPPYYTLEYAVVTDNMSAQNIQNFIKDSIRP